MDGLDRDTSKVDFSYDVESDFRDNNKFVIIQKNVSKRLDIIREALTEGTEKPNIDELGTILQGYIALQRVAENVREQSVTEPVPPQTKTTN